ncbi:MAG: response regulator transcription factor [bacterium]
MKKRILVIEDETDYKRIVSQLLEKEGHAVSAFETAGEGLEYLKKNLPDLIILDIGLPDASGLDICRKIRTDDSTSAVPIILFTVRSELDQVSKALDYGADDYILKPFDLEEFTLRVKAILEKAENKK